MDISGGCAGKTTKMKTVCVTGAGGFIASWLVQLLLSRGDYVVHGTVRDPSDPKNAHLMALGGAGERLRLFKADLLDYASVAAAVAGCDGVFHVASPVPAVNPTNPDVEVLAPAVTGTQNVLKASDAANARRVVVVSSVGAVIMNPKIPDGAVVNEDCWSDEDYCRTTENWYCLSKTLAEREALAYGEKAGAAMDVVTVCPPWVLGPLLQPTVNTTSMRLVAYLTGENTDEKMRNMVDVRDVVEALVLALETPEASGRRLICSAHVMMVSETVGLVHSLHRDLKLDYPRKFVQVEDEKGASSKRLQALGWKFRTAEQTLRDTIDSYKAAGILK
ncbi:hypothetical protein SETIT_4G212600v2 [Setaria italica]|uniref:NAD-dependent epimerase/dehydratase domain-containing protein n=1 Tax=Setaria italica TaxID=4555 RepID=K3XY53_SETIT|nr:cinnamoyl-CoA reductase 1 [Setaria italica]RCV22339.1 hypothetical protein SETIT_4G212600v2 [Setaria italica]